MISAHTLASTYIDRAVHRLFNSAICGRLTGLLERKENNILQQSVPRTIITDYFY